jgi:DNA-binding MarR family transcriptional regulator
LNATALRALYSAMSEISLGASPDLTLRQALFLLYVGAQGCPVGQGEVTSKLDLNKAAASKIATRLGGTTAGMIKSEEGLGLIDVNFDVSDFRLRVLSLTSKGESLLKRASAKLVHTQGPIGDEVSLPSQGVFPSAST